MDLNPNLKDRDFVFIVDFSGSMTSNSDTPTKQTRKQYMRERLEATVHELAPYDPDGVTIIAFDAKSKVFENTTPQKLGQVYDEFRGGGSTNLTAPLKWVREKYLELRKANQLKPNGMFVIVATDGAPDSQEEVVNEIAALAAEMTPEEANSKFGYLFLQVGEDGGAKKFLAYLDDAVPALVKQKTGKEVDIVDACAFDEIGDKTLEQLVLDSITG